MGATCAQRHTGRLRTTASWLAGERATATLHVADLAGMRERISKFGEERRAEAEKVKERFTALQDKFDDERIAEREQWAGREAKARSHAEEVLKEVREAAYEQASVERRAPSVER